MYLSLTEEQNLLADQLQTFARQQLTSQHPEHSPQEAQERFAQLAAQGVLGLCIPEADGGPGVDPVTLCRCLSAIATVDASLAAMAAIINGFVAEALLASNHPIRTQWLGKLQEGTPIAWCGNAPDTHQAIKQHVHTDELHFVGTQANVPMGAQATHVLLAATDAQGRPMLCPFAFLDAEAAGYQATPTQRTLGLRDAGFATLTFDWQVPGGQPLFPAKDAATQYQRIWHRGQVSLAAVSVGIAQAALDRACAYAQERKQFGKPIAAFQAIQWKVADMAMALEGARLLVDRAASAWAHGDEEHLAAWSSAARTAANTAATMAGQEAIQIHGGYGYTTEFPVERLYRDAHALRCLWAPDGDDTANLAQSSLHHH